LTTISEYRQKILENQKEESLSLESFVNKSRNSIKKENILKFIYENKNSIKYALYFFFSILKIRGVYDDPITRHFYHSNVFNYSEYDLQYKLDDFFNFIEKYPQNIYEGFKIFFNKLFDESQFNWFHSFNPIMFGCFHNDIIQPIERHKHVEINVKKANYSFLPLGRNQSKDIFEYIINTPSEDPIEIFGLNRNHEFSYNYHRSKNFFDYVVRNHYELEQKSSLQKEANYLNDVSPGFSEENLNKNLKEFLEFMTESFLENDNSSLLNLINLLTKIIKILGNPIILEKTEIFQKIFEEADEKDDEDDIENDNDISFLNDLDEKEEENYEDPSKSFSLLNKFEKNHSSISTFDLKIDTISDKKIFSLNFGKSSNILKRKRDEINDLNEKNKEQEAKIFNKKEIPEKKVRNFKFRDVIFRKNSGFFLIPINLFQSPSIPINSHQSPSIPINPH